MLTKQTTTPSKTQVSRQNTKVSYKVSISDMKCVCVFHILSMVGCAVPSTLYAGLCSKRLYNKRQTKSSNRLRSTKFVLSLTCLLKIYFPIIRNSIVPHSYAYEWVRLFSRPCPPDCMSKPLHSKVR